MSSYSRKHQLNGEFVLTTQTSTRYALSTYTHYPTIISWWKIRSDTRNYNLRAPILDTIRFSSTKEASRNGNRLGYPKRTYNMAYLCLV